MTTEQQPIEDEKKQTDAVENLQKQIQGEVNAVQEVLKSLPGEPATRQEISASTVGRMMGLATVTEIQLLESKLDSLGGKLINLSTRMDKVLAWLNRAPTGADLERIDVQVGALRSLIKDTLVNVAGEAKTGALKSAASDGTKKAGVKIISNNAKEEEQA
ncbi:MAG: hypothetical protein K1X83_03500 [Oligoflexia bacterium]|nr:hypothetical protein [Oligoflexia bacterium]